VVNRFGRLKVLDDRELVIEVEKMEDFQKLQKALQETFGGEAEAELILKK
jgi:GTP:adenosylcobinamide-phosphate guanylyltransferase